MVAQVAAVPAREAAPAEAAPAVARTTAITSAPEKRARLRARAMSTPPLTTAAAALAAAGAGLVAYSARRTALENDTADEVNSDTPR